MTTPDISVVIGSYNQSERLEKVIQGYGSQQCDISFEVIIVDSFSTDSTRTMISKFTYKDLPFKLRFIQKKNPSGKSEARNTGVRLSESTLIIISDADMIPDIKFIQAHYNAHKRQENVCFEGLTFNLKDYTWPPKKEDCSPYIEKKYGTGKRLGWYYFLTGNISFPKSLFLSMGGFDETFQNYGWEDLELGYRLSKKKVPLYYLKEAINYHYHVVSKKEDIERCTSKGNSAKLLIKKHPKLRLFLGLNPLSEFLYPRIKEDGYLVSKAWCWLPYTKCIKAKWAYWFLKEYYYLKGLLGPNQEKGAKKQAS